MVVVVVVVLGAGLLACLLVLACDGRVLALLACGWCDGSRLWSCGVSCSVDIFIWVQVDGRFTIVDRRRCGMLVRLFIRTALH